MRTSLSVWASLLGLSLTASCGGEGGEGMTYTYVLAEVGLIADANEDGSVVGLNLDDRVDDMPAPESCNKLDFTGPNGEPGVDNQLSLFGPILGLFGGDPAALIQGAINEGSLLILMEFEGLDSFENDNNVTVRIHFGTGPTDVGNDGLLVPGQSFDIKPDTVSVEMRNMRIVDGHMDADTFETVLPVAILDQRFNLPIFSGHLSIDFDTETGEITGLLGGGVPTQTLIDDLILMIPGGQDIAPIASLSLSRLADLEPNDIGGCLHLSTAMTIHGVTAFLLPPSEPVSE
jgi:hypothetical protein